MKKLPYLALAVAMGCSESAGSSEADEPVPTDGVTRAQLQAFEDFEAKTNLTWRWLQHDELKTPAHLSAARVGRAILTNGADPISTTLSVLDENRALFKMRDPSQELVVVRSEVDELGMTHARFQQLTHGVPVSGAEMMVHYDKAGHLASIDASYVPELDAIDVNPKLAVDDALALAKQHIVARDAVDEAKLESDDHELIVYVPHEDPAGSKLAYQLKVRALAAEHPAIWVLTVDAKTGEVIHRYDNLQTIQAQGTGVNGDQKKFEVTSNGNGFVMTDTSGGVQIQTFSAQSQQVTPGSPVTSNNQNSWDTEQPGPGAAVDAHVNAAIVFKYYKEVHARNALDDRGSPLISTAHFGQAYDNAAWDGKGMIYGDGGQIFRPLSVGLDVVGHEFSHGVTEKTSGLVYENQPGALNEAISDIMGAFIEHSVTPDAKRNWLIGELVSKNGAPLRDMATPGNVSQPQPSHMSKFVNTQQDNGGVHVNSGIINNAAMLMTVGGVNPTSKVELKYGIGWEKSEKLWYRANTKYFTSTTKFAAAAAGVLQAGKDIGLTPAETNIVECAFKATGIMTGECATLVDPKSAESPGTGGEDPKPGTGTGSTTDPGSGSEGSSQKRRRRVVQSTDTACSATSGPRSSYGFGLVLAIAGLALSRRSRKR